MSANAPAHRASARGNAGVLLRVENLTVRYGNIAAVHGISFEVNEGEIVTLIGANGAGKSSTLRAISGLIAFGGRVEFGGKDLARCASHQIVAMGVAQVPEGRGIFGSLTVTENLKLATWQRRDKAQVPSDMERVFKVFPRLRERQKQPAGTLSGGEQQMLAVGRALMSRARMMLLDEPSMGLAPLAVRDIFRVLQEINRAGTTILLVEQNANMALQAASRAYVLETGRIVLSGPASDLMQDPRVKEAYLGA